MDKSERRQLEATLVRIAAQRLPGGGIEAIRRLDVNWMMFFYHKLTGHRVMPSRSKNTEQLLTREESALFILHQWRALLGKNKTQCKESKDWLRRNGLPELIHYIG